MTTSEKYFTLWQLPFHYYFMRACLDIMYSSLPTLILFKMSSSDAWGYVNVLGSNWISKSKLSLLILSKGSYARRCTSKIHD